MPQTQTLRYYRGAERPDVWLWVRSGGLLVDFSTGYSFVFKLGTPGRPAVFTKSTGITGAAGSGVEPTGVPNVVIVFGAGELAAVPADAYTWQLKATTGGIPRYFQGPFALADIIT